MTLMFDSTVAMWVGGAGTWSCHAPPCPFRLENLCSSQSVQLTLDNIDSLLPNQRLEPHAKNPPQSAPPSTTTPMSSSDPAPPPWYAHLPAPTSTAPPITPSDLLTALADPAAAHTTLVIDVRRTDHGGGTLPRSLNLPAQSFHGGACATLRDLCVRGGVRRVVFTCASSRGRGPRCAGWFLDGVREGEVEVRVLEGGVKGWVGGGKRFTGVMEGFDEGFWREAE